MIVEYGVVDFKFLVFFFVNKIRDRVIKKLII